MSARIRAMVAESRGRLRRHDAMLAAAGISAYLALGAVPLLALAERITALITGPVAVRQTGAAAASYLPRTLDLAPAVRALADGGSRLGLGPALAALVISSLLSEGILRALARFSSETAGRRLMLKGRVCTLVLLGLATAAMLLLTVAGRPLLQHDFGEGTGPRLFGIWLAFVCGWIPGALLLAVLYRGFAARRLRWRSALSGAAVASSWLTGQSLGYVLVLRFVGAHIGAPYAGARIAGTVAAMLFLTYLQAIVFVIGFVVTVAVDDTRPAARAADEPPVAGPADPADPADPAGTAREPVSPACASSA